MSTQSWENNKNDCIYGNSTWAPLLVQRSSRCSGCLRPFILIKCTSVNAGDYLLNKLYAVLVNHRPAKKPFSVLKRILLLKHIIRWKHSPSRASDVQFSGLRPLDKKFMSCPSRSTSPTACQQRFGKTLSLSYMIHRSSCQSHSRRAVNLRSTVLTR